MLLLFIVLAVVVVVVAREDDIMLERLDKYFLSLFGRLPFRMVGLKNRKEIEKKNVNKE